MSTKRRLLQMVWLLGLPVLLPHAACAEQPRRGSNRVLLSQTLTPLNDARLAQYRGGFVDLRGVKISFGLERKVWVNDQLVHSLTVTVPDLRSLSSRGSARAASARPQAASVSVAPVAGPLQVTPAPGSAATASGAAQAPGSSAVATSFATTGGSSVASVIQNGPGNIIAPDVLRNLGPGTLSVIQNTLDNQTIQGMTVINAQLSGLRTVLRQDVLSNLQINLKGAGR